MSISRPLTAKILDAYGLCPMKYRLYRLGDPSRGLTRRVNAARALHAAVKRCLDECYRAGGPRIVPAAALLETFASCFDGTACADSREEDECRAAGVAMLQGYHADHVDDETVETEVEIALAGAIGEHEFEAHADRRDLRPDGRIVYLLYTTARRPPTEGPLERDLQTGVLQLLGAQREGRPVTVEVHVLRTRRVLIATKPADPLAEVRDRLAALASAVQQTESYPAIRGKHCRWCHARTVCPEWGRRRA